MIEAGIQGDRDFIVFSDANLLNELLQNGAAFIVVGGVVNIRPCKQLVADVVATLCCFLEEPDSRIKALLFGSSPPGIGGTNSKL